MADITSVLARLNGLNSDAQYVHTDAYRLPFMELGIDEAGTHLLAVLPKGVAVTCVRVVVLTALASSNGTFTFKAKCGTSEIALTSALAVAKFSKGAVLTIPVNEKAAYFPDGDVTLGVTNAAAVTAGEIILLVDTIPVQRFITNG